jgi:hypothetical protein
MIVDILVLDQGSLTANLSTNFIVRKTSRREEGNFLATGNGVHDINGGETSLNHLLGILTLVGVNRLTLDIEEILSEHWRSMINGNTRTVELATEHLSRDRHAEHIAGEFDVSLQVVNVGGSFENLNNGTFAGDFEDLTLAHLAVSESNVDDFGVFGELDIVKNDEGALDIENCAVVHARSNVVVAHGCFDVGD